MRDGKPKEKRARRNHPSRHSPGPPSHSHLTLAARRRPAQISERVNAGGDRVSLEVCWNQAGWQQLSAADQGLGSLFDQPPLTGSFKEISVRGGKKLGMAIVGGIDTALGAVHLERVDKNRAGAESGLAIGDVILAVNDHGLLGLTNSQAHSLIAQLASAKKAMRFLVLRIGPTLWSQAAALSQRFPPSNLLNNVVLPLPGVEDRSVTTHGAILQLRVHRDTTNTGLGLAVAGGRDNDLYASFISDVAAGGPCAEVLAVGDRLLEVGAKRHAAPCSPQRLCHALLQAPPSHHRFSLAPLILPRSPLFRIARQLDGVSLTGLKHKEVTAALSKAEGTLHFIVQRLGEDQWRKLQVELGILQSRRASAAELRAAPSSQRQSVSLVNTMPRVPEADDDEDDGRASMASASQQRQSAMADTHLPSSRSSASHTMSRATSGTLEADALLFDAPAESELQASPRRVVITRTNGRLGISVMGDTVSPGNIFIASVSDTVDAVGVIQRGARILSIDNESMSNHTQVEALALLKGVSSTVQLEVVDDPAGFFTWQEANDILPDTLREVTLQRDGPGTAWGIRLFADAGQNPIFITHVLPNSPAARSGHLLRGDRVLAINGTDTEEVSQQTARQLVATQPTRLRLSVQRDENEWAMVRALIRDRARGAPREVPVSLAEQGWQENSSAALPEGALDVVVARDNGRFGLRLIGDADKRGDGVYLDSVNNTSARAAGVEAGMRVYMVDNTDVRLWNQPEVLDLLKRAGDTVRLVVAADDEGMDRFREEGAGDEPQDRRSSMQRATAQATEAAAAAAEAAMPPVPPPSDGAQVRRVQLVAQDKRYGLSVLGDDGFPGPIFVADLVAGGAADINGNLRRGDRILSINGTQTKRCLKGDAVALIRGSGQGMTLEVVEDQALFKNVMAAVSTSPLPASAPSAAGGTASRIVVLQRKDHPYGITLLAGSEPSPVYIATVKPGGAAALSDEPVEVGDRILSINDTPTLMATQSTAGRGLRFCVPLVGEVGVV